MSALTFDLNKQTQALSFVLQKNNVSTIIPCQVHLAFDVSYSFHDEHRDGYTQQLLNRFVPFSMLFDKNQLLDSYVFSHVCEKLEDITEHNFQNYVQKFIQKSDSYNGGTDYLPIFQLLLEQTGDSLEEVVTKTYSEPKGFFNRLLNKKEVTTSTKVVVKENEDKHLVFFVTDGEASDQEQAKRFLSKKLLENTNPYIVFISIANRDFSFFKNNYKDTKYSNYFNLTPKELHDLGTASDSDLYEKIISPSLIEWMKN